MTFPHWLGIAVALTAVAIARPAIAQHDMPAMAASDSAPPLFQGLGKLHRKITTSSPQAQQYFDQGLRLLYAFNHDEAQRSFEQAARLDTNCAMCWWGAALTLGPNINLPPLPDRAKAAYGYERRALAKSGRAPKVERELIRALNSRYTLPPPDDPVAQQRLDNDYAWAMHLVAQEFPGDDDVQVLYAESMMDLRPWNLWTLEGKPQPGTLQIKTTLERVLARDALHPGANHYYIHTMEGSTHPELAMACAERLPTLMPGAGHIVHMPSHIFIRTGNYREAAEANRRAIAVDQQYVALRHPQGFYTMYVAHNHQFLWASAMMLGRSAEAIAAARHAVESVPLDMMRQMPGFDFALEFPIQALTRFGRWDEVLKEPAPPAEFRFATAMWHYARGRAFSAKNDFTAAYRELESVSAALDATDSKATESLNSARSLLAIADHTLRGDIAARQANIDKAVGELARAVAIEDSLNYSEPPDWYYPVRHTLGAVLLKAGRPHDAEAVYRADLVRHPSNGWSLFGLAMSLDAQRRKEEAAPVWTRFMNAWNGADVRLAATDY